FSLRGVGSQSRVPLGVIAGAVPRVRIPPSPQNAGSLRRPQSLISFSLRNIPEPGSAPLRTHRNCSRARFAPSAHIEVVFETGPTPRPHAFRSLRGGQTALIIKPRVRSEGSTRSKSRIFSSGDGANRSEKQTGCDREGSDRFRRD